MVVEGVNYKIILYLVRRDFILKVCCGSWGSEENIIIIKFVSVSRVRRKINKVRRI